MNGEMISIAVDVLILLFLAATIFFAARLSYQLKVFRQSRKDMEKLLGDLSGNIVRAEQAIAGLRETARESGRDVQEVVNRARDMTAELELITESADKIAARLEKSVSTGRRAARHNPGAAKTPAKEPAMAETGRAGAESGFAIRDPDFGQSDSDSGLSDTDLEEKEIFADHDQAQLYNRADDADNLQSQAERDLYEALRRNKKAGAGGVS